MFLHDSILWAMGPDGASGINIFCEESVREEVAEFFEDTFNAFWEEAEDAVAAAYGNCTEKGCPSPMAVSVSDEGVLASLEPLYLSFNFGDQIVSDDTAEDALQNALKKLTEEYPDVSYEGYIGFQWTDIHSGDVTQYEFSSDSDSFDETDRVYGFVGNALCTAMETEEEEFWDTLEGELESAEIEDFEQVANCFRAYAEWLPEDTMDRLLDVADEINEEIRPVLEEDGE